MKLEYRTPATDWEQTLPIGNGSLGGMIFGNVYEECIGLNEESLWSGYPKDYTNKEASQYLNQIRTLVTKEKYEEADQLVMDKMLGMDTEAYLPLGTLLFHYHYNGCKKNEFKNYKRNLNIDEAIVSISYEMDGHNYNREYFISYPEQAMLIRLSCNHPVMNVDITFSSELKTIETYNTDRILIEGQCPEHVEPEARKDWKNGLIQGTRGIKFQAELSVLSTDGTLSIQEDRLNIHHSKEIILKFSAVKKSAIPKDYWLIRKYHIEDYQKIFHNVFLDLGPDNNLPIDERLEQLRNGNEDPGLYALYFQYGRYLLISSSRKGSLPANLQGIWNWKLYAPWRSNWTVNINLQMNYWPVHTCNLMECFPPYIDFMKKICENGKKTAWENYRCRGFVVHHNVDGWFNTAPVGINYQGKNIPYMTGCAMWPMGGVWLLETLYEHYEYSNDADFLEQTVYPIMKEAVLFLVDWIYEEDGVYHTCPSTTPENRFISPNGNDCATAKSSTMDLTLIKELFRNFKKTCNILKKEEPLLKQIETIETGLYPFQVGLDGRLLEWYKDFKEYEPGHRHVSHLYGLYPSDLFEEDNVLKEACKNSLLSRLANGGGHTGWSCAWIINLFAVLEDAEKAYEYLQILLTKSTYDNLWDAHPPFQIDGNFGGIAGIANMLVQERNGVLKLLPALPKAFCDGMVKGLCLKDNRTIDLKWKSGKLEHYEIHENKSSLMSTQI